MPDLSSWNVRGPVETLRTESAEWDLATEAWKAPWGFSMIRFRPDGRISETEYHNPDGSISRTLNLYDEAGRILEVRHRSNDTITGKQIWLATGRQFRRGATWWLLTARGRSGLRVWTDRRRPSRLNRGKP